MSKIKEFFKRKQIVQDKVNKFYSEARDIENLYFWRIKQQALSEKIKSAREKMRVPDKKSQPKVETPTEKIMIKYLFN